MEKAKKCDIIIPVYNAYESLIDCIKSVIKNTDLNGNELIIIDDKSTDKRIKPYLSKLKKNNKNINLTILENATNIGFVGTVNRGMKESKNDVLLLNSDTEVPQFWLDNIKKCAYSGEKIATVTPLSNNATLVSAPIGLQKNDIPSNYTFEEYAKIIRNCAYNDNNNLPTAHGFCMYITREALDIVGFFDTKNFGKGYGEENDFSYRCLNYGYQNLLCDSVIVYHKESQSFSQEKDNLRKEHQKILDSKYPVFSSKTNLWCNSFPINYVCKNIKYSININKRINILVLIHEWDCHQNQNGGTTLYMKNIINNLRDKYNFHVLTIETNGHYRLYSYFKNDEEIIDLNSINNSGIFPMYNFEYRRMLEKIIDSFNISIIHLNHMINQFFDIGSIIKEKKIFSIITLHDFYALCPSINMLCNDENDCLSMDKRPCDKCLYKKFRINDNIIANWQNTWNDFLRNFNTIIVPSEYAKKVYKNEYSDINFTIIEHGVDLNINYPNKLIKKRKYNIAFVGVIAPHKGLNVVKTLIKKMQKDNVEMHLFGYSTDEELNKNNKNYYYHGKYEEKNITKLLKENNIDLVCLFSICSETYSYTLTESLAAGIPILAFDIGAIGDRLKKNKCGYTIPVNSNIDDIRQKIKEIFNNKQYYDQIIDNIKKYNIKSINEMIEDYDKLYQRGKITVIDDCKDLKVFVKDAFKKNDSISNETMNMITNSLKWRVVSKIKIPKVITKLVKKIIK